MKRYVWLDMNTGKFSNSWDEETHKLVTNEMIQDGKDSNWKLIEYTCINDAEFEFYHLMKISY